MTTSDESVCYRHRDRRAGVICQRCDRPICPDCMHQASVGFHCPECTRTGKQQVIRGLMPFDPWITKALISLNVVAFVGSALEGRSLSGTQGRVFQEGALYGPAVDAGDLWRIVTSGFLHVSVLHLAFNMYALWIMGPQLERVLGRARFGVLYATALVGGSFGALLLDPQVPAIGASGAVFGLFGAMAALQRAMGMSIWSSGLGPVLAINFVLTFGLSFISVGGHVGGFVVGAAVGGLYVALARWGRSERQAALAAVGLLIAVSAGAVWAASMWSHSLF